MGKFYQQNVRHEDYFMWLNILRHVDGAVCIPQVLASYRVSCGSISSNKFKSLYWTWCLYRKTLDFNIFQSTYLFTHSIFRSLLKRI